jgi:hypothetical protein
MDFGLFFLRRRDEAWSELAVYDFALEQRAARLGRGHVRKGRAPATHDPASPLPRGTGTALFYRCSWCLKPTLSETKLVSDLGLRCQACARLRFGSRATTGRPSRASSGPVKDTPGSPGCLGPVARGGGGRPPADPDAQRCRARARPSCPRDPGQDHADGSLGVQGQRDGRALRCRPGRRPVAGFQNQKPEPATPPYRTGRINSSR